MTNAQILALMGGSFRYIISAREYANGSQKDGTLARFLGPRRDRADVVRERRGYLGADAILWHRPDVIPAAAECRRRNVSVPGLRGSHGRGHAGAAAFSRMEMGADTIRRYGPDGVVAAAFGSGRQHVRGPILRRRLRGCRRATAAASPPASGGRTGR